MKKTAVTFLVFWIAFAFSGNAAVILLKNAGATVTTGDSLDEMTTTPTTNSVVEISGLQIIITDILSTDTGAKLNSLSTSFGVDSDNSGDSDAFDATFGEGFTFQFDKDVSISQLDFTTFTTGEAVSFAGMSIGDADAPSSVYDFSTPLRVSANTDITLRATAGIVGIEAITLTVVPEPATMSLVGIAGLLAMLARRFKLRT